MSDAYDNNKNNNNNNNNNNNIITIIITILSFLVSVLSLSVSQSVSPPPLPLFPQPLSLTRSPPWIRPTYNRHPHPPTPISHRTMTGRGMVQINPHRVECITPRSTRCCLFTARFHPGSACLPRGGLFCNQGGTRASPRGHRSKEASHPFTVRCSAHLALPVSATFLSPSPWPAGAKFNKQLSGS